LAKIIPNQFLPTLEVITVADDDDINTQCILFDEWLFDMTGDNNVDAHCYVYDQT
jgi:hypothetical protein